MSFCFSRMPRSRYALAIISLFFSALSFAQPNFQPDAEPLLDEIIDDVLRYSLNLSGYDHDGNDVKAGPDFRKSPGKTL